MKKRFYKLTRVARYGLGKRACMNDANPCVNWVFTPNPITDCSSWTPLKPVTAPDFKPISYLQLRSVTLPPSVTGQDFVAIRLGDVTGNWAADTGSCPTSARSRRNDIEKRENPTHTLTTQPGFMCKVPILLNKSAEIRGLEITTEFDKAVVSVADVTLSGGIPDGKEYSAPSDKDIAGKVRIWISSQNDTVTGSGVVANIYFTPLGNSQTYSRA